MMWMAPTSSFTLSTPSLSEACSSTRLYMGYSAKGRSSPRYGKERSKRQERVGHLVRTELSQIIHTGLIKGDPDYLEDELRKRISIVNADVSPDLKQARVAVSIRKGVANEGSEGSNAVVDRRRAYSWLVQNTKELRHTLAQRMSHVKATPDLTFVQVDISAAVDVMYLIDKVSAGAKRTTIGTFGGDDESLPRGMVEGMEFEDFDFDDDDGWIDDDEDDDEGDDEDNDDA
jgi:ribosome-binding factor A